MIFMVGMIGAAAMWVYLHINSPKEDRVSLVGFKVTRLQIAMVGVLMLAFGVMETLVFLQDNELLRIPLAAGMYTLAGWLLLRAAPVKVA